MTEVSLFDFLAIYAQVTLAAAAFMAIVATLQQTAGGKFNPYEYLIVRYIVDVGLTHVFFALVGIALLTMFKEPDVLKVLAWLFAAYIAFYYPYYIAKRRKTKAPWVKTTFMVAIGTALYLIVLLLTVTVLIPLNIKMVVIGYLIWAFITLALIFLVFMARFLLIEE